MEFEQDNLKQEIREMIEKCTKCGRCRLSCPVLRVLREEQFSPRGKVILLENNYYEDLIYDCTLCKSCEKECPFNIKLCEVFIKARTVIISQKREHPENKKMLKNMQKSGNIFGIEEENKD